MLMSVPLIDHARLVRIAAHVARLQADTVPIIHALAEKAVTLQRSEAQRVELPLGVMPPR